MYKTARTWIYFFKLYRIFTFDTFVGRIDLQAKLNIFEPTGEYVENGNQGGMLSPLFVEQV